MVSLKEKLLKNSTIEFTSTLTDSKIYSKKDIIPTPVPMINVALSGTVDGGLTPGLTMLAGPSKHFKSGFSLLMAKSFLKKYPDGIILFYDNEFGTPQAYFNTFGIPLDSVIHTPITDIEMLKVDLVKQLENITRDDHVLIIIDSIGNLASKKELDDAIKGEIKADVGIRAKALKSLWRMITPHLTIKDVPLIVVNHTYKEIALYPKDVVSGGTGHYYSADNIWIIGRQQEKDGTEISGYNFVINIEKSRFVKEKEKIPISISFDGGINRWSGLVDVALEGNYIAKPKNGWYCLVDRETGELIEPNMRLSDFNDNKDFWINLFDTTDFADFIKSKYYIGHGLILEDDDDKI